MHLKLYPYYYEILRKSHEIRFFFSAQPGATRLHSTLYSLYTTVIIVYSVRVLQPYSYDNPDPDPDPDPGGRGGREGRPRSSSSSSSAKIVSGFTLPRATASKNSNCYCDEQRPRTEEKTPREPRQQSKTGPEAREFSAKRRNRVRVLYPVVALVVVAVWIVWSVVEQRTAPGPDSFAEAGCRGVVPWGTLKTSEEGKSERPSAPGFSIL